MARVVDSASHIPVRSPRVSWERFSDGQLWRLERGEDFIQSAAMARKAFISWASRHGRATHTVVDGDDVVYVQVTSHD